VSATKATWPPVSSRSSRARASSREIDAATTPTRRASPFAGSPTTTGAEATTARLDASRIVAAVSFHDSSASATQRTSRKDRRRSSSGGSSLRARRTPSRSKKKNVRASRISAFSFAVSQRVATSASKTALIPGSSETERRVAFSWDSSPER
jgi:hypothetical protein